MNAELLSGRRVLVVEDEMMVLMVIEYMLADLGCRSVTAAATVAQALTLIAGQIFDAAVLDVNLAGAKSYPVADRLADLGVPFIFSTGYSDQGMQESYLHRPMLKKPYQFRELSDMFARVLPC